MSWHTVVMNCFPMAGWLADWSADCLPGLEAFLTEEKKGFSSVKIFNLILALFAVWCHCCCCHSGPGYWSQYLLQQKAVGDDDDDDAQCCLPHMVDWLAVFLHCQLFCCCYLFSYFLLVGISPKANSVPSIEDGRAVQLPPNRTHTLPHVIDIHILTIHCQ